jgi:hypothetical protein
MAQSIEVQTVTIFSLIQRLSLGEVIELKGDDSIKISEFEIGDFMSLVNEEDNRLKLNVIQKALSHFGLLLNLEGSINLGNLNLDDRSWTLSAGQSGSLKISAKSFALKKSVDELVAFLKKLPVDQGLVLKAGQDLLLEGFNHDAVKAYFELSSKSKDPKVLEKVQDDFFVASSKVLQDEGLVLKVFAVEAASLNREVNPELGLVVFKPQAQDETKAPRVVVALTKKTKV